MSSMFEFLSSEKKEEILGEKELKLSYTFNEFDYNTKSKDRVLSGISQLDYLIKGFEMGCITIWTGITNAGKTTILTKIAKETLKQGERIFFFNGEQTKDDFKNNLYMQFVDKDDIYAVRYKDTNIYDYYVKDLKARYLQGVYDNKITIYNNNAPKNIDAITLAMRQAKDTRVFIIDNFMQIDISSERIYEEQTRIIESLRTFAINENVHIHLVAHPRKIENWQVRLSLYDISGSMNLANKAYNVISIIRRTSIQQDSREYEILKRYMLDNRYDIEECDTMLEVLKQKGNGCGIVGLIYNPDTRTYEEQKQMDIDKWRNIQRAIKENKELKKQEKEGNLKWIK